MDKPKRATEEIREKNAMFIQYLEAGDYDRAVAIARSTCVPVWADKGKHRQLLRTSFGDGWSDDVRWMWQHFRDLDVRMQGRV
jgi:hypothetical protein